MRTKMYTIYDRKAMAYHMPFYAITDAVGVRTFSDAVSDPQSIFARHPNDYVLYLAGEFDDSNGQLWPEQPLKHVIDASALVKALQSEIPFPENATTTKPSKLDGPGPARLSYEEWVALQQQGGK